MALQLKSRGGAVIEKQTSEKKKKNFIDNVEFFQEINEYLTKCNEAEANGLEIPRIPDSIGKKFLMISEALGKKYYFIGYSWRDEMVMDGVETCIKYIRKFNPEKTQNPFSYFTQICFYAFIQRIRAEKKQSYVKSSIIKNLGVMFDEVSVNDGDLDEDYHTSMGEILSLQQDESLERLFNKPKEKKSKESKSTTYNVLDISPEDDEELREMGNTPIEIQDEDSTTE